MNRKVYTQALINALNSGLKPDQALLGLRRTLETRGHTSLYAPIIKDVVMILKKHESEVVATIVLAQKDDEKLYTTQIERFLSSFAMKKKIIVDETIIGGFIAKTKKIEHDQSYKESLASIYRSLTVH